MNNTCRAYVVFRIFDNSNKSWKSIRLSTYERENDGRHCIRQSSPAKPEAIA